ncbi:MAG TPA: alpha/beta fold hydrolase [Chryseolinea sp.]|nr:alpha/beta fold hydrolase [Chryseolinea sp.]
MVLKRFYIYYVVLVISALAAASFALVYQEYGPVDEEKLVSQRVRRNDVVADFFYPKEGNHLPLVVALAGSGGGFLPDKELQSLALEGYAVLSLAYFNADLLPKKIENIPLEYFDVAIDWSCNQSIVDTGKIILLGVSRGAELALLLASHYSRFKGVIAYSPGCFVLPNAVDSDDSIARKSSWSWQGKPISFAPLPMLQRNHGEAIDYRRYIEPLLKNLDNEPYTIPVERVKGSILLLSGEDDQTWPSAEMAMLIEQRLKENQYPYSVRNVVFPDAGHSLFQLQNNYQLLSSTFFRGLRFRVNGKQYRFNLGGSPWADMLAKRKARSETLQFLKQFKSSSQFGTTR